MTENPQEKREQMHGTPRIGEVHAQIKGLLEAREASKRFFAFQWPYREMDDD